jgi:hypothetical protein
VLRRVLEALAHQGPRAASAADRSRNRSWSPASSVDSAGGRENRISAAAPKRERVVKRATRRLSFVRSPGGVRSVKLLMRLAPPEWLGSGGCYRTCRGRLLRCPAGTPRRACT